MSNAQETLALPNLLNRSAVISRCRNYRYRLDRTWNRHRGRMCWVMLNPSTADGEQDDHTIRRCMDFAERDCFGGIVVVNLFALRATDPKALTDWHKTGGDVVGPDNLHHVEQAIAACEMIVVAWGFHGGLKFAAKARHHVRVEAWKRSRKLYCLGTTDSGDPRHPSRMSSRAPFIEWREHNAQD